MEQKLKKKKNTSMKGPTKGRSRAMEQELLPSANPMSSSLPSLRTGP